MTRCAQTGVREIHQEDADRVRRPAAPERQDVVGVDAGEQPDHVEGLVGGDPEQPGAPVVYAVAIPFLLVFGLVSCSP
ncbi:MAG: hypothetical protein K0S40_436 [Actinomycetospora sp.]|nr:hypothetical protein [Actinomycetospora sp.]